MATVFFSWQADRPGKTGRHLIHAALQDAVDAIAAEAEVEDVNRTDLRVDKDTTGVPGTPPIFETILKKIDAASGFVADVTFVGERPDLRRMPNPNVLIEYGYALHSLGWQRMVCVMNAAHGAPTRESLPFDLGHMRLPHTYNCPDNADAGTIEGERKRLAAYFKVAVRAILEQDAPKPAAAAPHVRATALDGKGRFRVRGEPIGNLHSFTLAAEEPKPILFAQGPCMWLRLMPVSAIEEPLQGGDISNALVTGGRLIAPLNSRGQSPGFKRCRGVDGYGMVATLDDKNAEMVIYVFESGEIWSIDTTYLSDARGRIVFDSSQFSRALAEFASVLRTLGVKGPYQWEAGIEGVKGRRLAPPNTAFTFPPPEYVKDYVIREGDYSGDSEDAASAIGKFVSAVYDAGGLKQ